MFLLVIALAMTMASIIGKSMAVALVRRYEDTIAGYQKKLADLHTQLKISQQKHVIAKKAEGIAAHKAATLKYRMAQLEDQMTDVELLEVKQELERNREVTVVLDQVVRKALGNIGRGGEERVQKVMGVITTLIDMEKHGTSDDLIAAIREKLLAIKEGLVMGDSAREGDPGQGRSAPEGGPDAATAEPSAAAQEEPGAPDSPHSVGKPAVPLI